MVLVLALGPLTRFAKPMARFHWLIQLHNGARSAAQHGFYARPAAHLPTLSTRAGLGTIFGSSGIAGFVQGGVVKTFRYPPSVECKSAVSRISGKLVTAYSTLSSAISALTPTQSCTSTAAQFKL